MEEVAAKFIYQPNSLLGILLLIALMASIAKPQLLAALATGILLIRPNERMELGIPLIMMLLPVTILVIVMHANEFIRKTEANIDKYLYYFIAVIIVQTLLLHQSDILYNMLLLSTGVMIYCAIITFMDDDAGIKRLCVTITISCFVICFEPTYYHYMEPQGSALWNMFHLTKSGRLQAWGMWANANETAFIACIGIANILLLTFKYKSTIFFAMSAVLIPFFALVVFLTASRAGLASLVLIFVPSILFIRKTSVKILIALTIACILLTSQSLTPERTDVEGSTRERVDLRYRGKHLILDYPLMGVGFGRARYEMGSTPVHNTYIQAFAETGIFGGMLFITYVYKVGKKLYMNIKINNAGHAKPYLIIVLGLYCSTIFYLFFGNQLLSIIFFLIMAQLHTLVSCNDTAVVPQQGIVS